MVTTTKKDINERCLDIWFFVDWVDYIGVSVIWGLGVSVSKTWSNKIISLAFGQNL